MLVVLKVKGVYETERVLLVGTNILIRFKLPNTCTKKGTDHAPETSGNPASELASKHRDNEAR